MIERTILEYLTGALDVPVYTERPRERPTRFVTFEKTGGGARERLRTATVAVQSWAESLYEAARLNEDAIAAMELLPALPEIARCRLNADYPFPDTDEKAYRYQAVFDIVHY